MSRPAAQGVIFDLDGTLVDTLADIGAAMNAVLAARGLPIHPVPAYRAMLGWGMRRLVALALPAEAADSALQDAVVAEMMAEYGRHPLDRSRPYDGIPELVEALRRRGIPMAVLSNKPDALTVAIVDALFPGRPFRAVQGERPGLPRKPDPAAALALCATLGREPGQVRFLGDTAVDMETARRAGMDPIGALWGFRDEAELRQAGARMVAAHPREVLDLLGP